MSVMEPEALFAVEARVSAARPACSAPRPYWSMMSPRYFAEVAASTLAAEESWSEARTASMD
jgi:hypothetical protein